MARWSGQPELTEVLKAAAAGRERCFLDDGAVLTGTFSLSITRSNELSEMT